MEYRVEIREVRLNRNVVYFVQTDKRVKSKERKVSSFGFDRKGNLRYRHFDQTVRHLKGNMEDGRFVASLFQSEDRLERIVSDCHFVLLSLQGVSYIIDMLEKKVI